MGRLEKLSNPWMRIGKRDLGIGLPPSLRLHRADGEILHGRDDRFARRGRGDAEG